MADGPTPQRIEPDKPIESFNLHSKNIQLNEKQQKLSSKYSNLRSIFSSDPNITIENLAKELGVSTGTAHAVKKEWFAEQPAPRPVDQIRDLIPKMPKGKTLTAKEAQDLAEPFLSALENDFHTLDTYLWSRQKLAGKDTDEQPVWSDLDEEECQALTAILLKWGQKNAGVATVVRSVVDMSDYVVVGTIFVPRIKRTVEIMRETRIPRQRRGQNANQA